MAGRAAGLVWLMIPFIALVPGTVIALLAAYLGRKRSVIVGDIASGDVAVIASMVGLLALGAAMGAVWHLSRRVVEHVGGA